MLEDILQQLVGGAHEMPPEQMHGHLDTLLQQAPDTHVHGAIGDALQALGPRGFGQSVAQAAQGMDPQQQQGLVGLLGQAIEEGGGSLSGVLGALGLGGAGAGAPSGGLLPGVLGTLGLGGGDTRAPSGGYAPHELGALAAYALENHGGALQSILGQQASSGGSDVLKLLGSPTVQRVGMHLAQRLLGDQGY
jgi:hypothetical protein